MLVLGRKQMESIYIGQDITVTVLSVQRGRVRLGIDAPSDVSILRGELVLEDKSFLTGPTDEKHALSRCAETTSQFSCPSPNPV